MKTVVITGATSGIGLETAKKLAKKGFRVLGVGRSTERFFALGNRLCGITFGEEDKA